MKAERLEWDSIRSHWIISNYYIRTINGMEETLKKGARLDTVMPFTPADFMEDIEDVKIMNYFALRRQIKEKELRGDPGRRACGRL